MAVERFKTQVLILHPQQAVLDACQKAFGEDYTVHLAQTGREALSMLGDTPVDFFVTAEDLPGMTGSEAFKEARRRSPNMQGLLIAPREASADELSALASSRDLAAVLKSNSTPRELQAIVAETARRNRMSDLGESANDADHVVDTSASAVNLPAPGVKPEKPLFADDAPDEADPARAIDVTATAAPLPSAGMRTHAGGAAVEVLVLTKDEAFYHAIGNAARGDHSVHRAPTLQEAADIIASGRVGVLVTDAAVAPTDVQKITARLRQVQPALVTIVAGRRDDGDQLMGLISDGIVYRFLLKPVSPGRARLALEASVKKTLEYRDDPPPAPQPPTVRSSGIQSLTAARESIIDYVMDEDSIGGKFKMIGLAAVALVALGAVALWWTGRDSASTPDTNVAANDAATDAAAVPAESTDAADVAAAPAVDTAPAPVVDDTAPNSVDDQVFALRRDAFRALAAGQVAAPDDDNALSLYAAALRLDPYAEGLRDELASAIAEALSLTEAAMISGALDEAAAILARIREVQPYQARLPFLESQLRKERIRRLIAQARTSAANGDSAGGLAILDRAAGLSSVSDPAIAAARDEIIAGDDSRELQQLLELASERLGEGSLVAPAEDNAAFYYRAALAQDPENRIARQGLELIGASLLTDANRAFQNGRLDQATSLLDAAQSARAPAAGVRNLRADISAERGRQVAAARAAAEQRAAEERAAAERDAAEQAAAEAAAIAAAGDAADSDGAAPAAAETPAQLPPLVRSRYVAPSFPRAAARRNRSGWVALKFRVAVDGSVSDVTVIDSEPGSTFVNAARSALEQWEYEPTIVDGVAIEREADIRINFSLSE